MNKINSTNKINNTNKINKKKKNNNKHERGELRDTFYFGAHTNTHKDLVVGAQQIKDAGGNLIQIFLSRPGSVRTSEKHKPELDQFSAYLKQNNMRVVVHSSYTNNIARDWDEHTIHLKNLELEIKYAHYIGAIGLVLHFGKRLELSIEEAFNNMYTSLIYVHNRTKEYRVPILLETSTGQGSEVCFRLEELSKFYKKFSKNENKEIRERVKLCIDTCHIFAAGYSLKTENEIKRYLEAFEELIGLRYVKLIHLNDSSGDVGCQLDRHANIGDGFIGREGLQYFFDYFRKLSVPIVLETPDGGYKTEIRLLLGGD